MRRRGGISTTDLQNVDCPYCGKPAQLVTGATLYPNNPATHHRYYYRCSPCFAWVGCHKRTLRPMGTLADADLRLARRRAHAVFDPLWQPGAKGKDPQRRRELYHWLASQLGIKPVDCHIGYFDMETCARVIDLCRNRMLLNDQAED